MFGGSMMRNLDDDPFFDMHRAHMQQMNQMMQNPFGHMGGSPFMPVTDGREQRRDHQRRGERTRDREIARRDPFGGQDVFGDMFGNMNRMMSNMRHMMTGMNQGIQPQQMTPQANGNFYSQSTVMTYSNDGKNQPKVYQASTSTRQTGEVKETRKTVRDSARGIEKIAVGHHIGEKSHVISKERDRSGAMVENQDLVNLDEEEVTNFNEEWRQKTRSSHPHHRHHSHRSGHNHQRSLGYTPAPKEDTKLRELHWKDTMLKELHWKDTTFKQPSQQEKKVKFHTKQ